MLNFGGNDESGWYLDTEVFIIYYVGCCSRYHTSPLAITFVSLNLLGTSLDVTRVVKYILSIYIHYSPETHSIACICCVPQTNLIYQLLSVDIRAYQMFNQSRMM